MSSTAASSAAKKETPGCSPFAWMGLGLGLGLGLGSGMGMGSGWGKG